MSKRILFNLYRLCHNPYYKAAGFVLRHRCRYFSKLLLGAATGVIVCRSLVAPAHANEQDTSIVEEADKLYNGNGDLRRLYDFLKRYESSSNSDILWRLGRAARDLALKGDDVDADERKKLVYEALEFSKRSLEADELNFAAHKWFAITIGDVGDYEGVKIKISNAYIIRDHLQRAIELNPSDATTLHCLGMWCFVFAEMPRWQRYIAGVVFSTPPTSTFEEAADYFAQAEKVEGGFYSVNLLMLGKCYMKMGDHKRALLFLDRVCTFPVANGEDARAKSEAESLMKEVLKR